MPTVQYRVHGRVQGVGFRWWTRARARELGLAGQVRNCPDGTVEVRARGELAELEALAQLLQQGPPGALVTRLDQHPLGDAPLQAFEIVG